MSKLLGTGLVIAAICFAATQMADAGHRHWRSGCGCACASPCGTPAAGPKPPMPAPAAPAPAPAPPSAAVPPGPDATNGQTAQTENQGETYRSLSAEPTASNQQPAAVMTNSGQGSYEPGNTANDRGNPYRANIYFSAPFNSGSVSRGGTAGSPTP
jgi:hypothetical protein